MGLDHSSPTWQLHSLGSLLSSHLADEECLHLYKGDVDVTPSQGCPAHQMSHHTDSTYSQLLWLMVNTHVSVGSFTLYNRTKSAGSELWAPPKEDWALTAPYCLTPQALPGHWCVFSGEGTAPWDQ